MPPKPPVVKKRKVDPPSAGDPLDDEHDEAGPSTDLDTSKRGPGRPRGSRSAPEPSLSAGAPATDGEPVQKRPRGRPKKIRTEEELREIEAKLNKPKGKRGRPRKKRPEDEEREGGESAQGTEGTGAKPPSRGPDGGGAGIPATA